MSLYRTLSDKEIATLVVYGCSAENWKEVKVVEDFSPDYISNTHFSGAIRLGKYEKTFELPGGVKKHAGIFNVLLHNCSVGNDVYINKINNYIANYEIGDGAFIENVDLICVDGKTAFGNGTEISVMIESGGRVIPIFDNLSAPFAYMHVFYRHNLQLIERLNTFITRRIDELSSENGSIGQNVIIVNAKSIKNARIGAFAEISGASLLRNGTIISSKEAPVKIGLDVQCEDFIIQSGSSVTDAAMLTRCFVGQGCSIGKQFSAIDSLFFANCQGLHGEAVSVFAGPYTVTHHKSTLMLTAFYSFMNAGSGTNFSNHMYKLGPVHQGVLERGVKTSSDSYIMWPARIGAFSVILGKLKGNPDTQNLPFSYIIESAGECHIMPGINLHSAGTIRDVQKWPKRDLRRGENLDPIVFDFLSPYTIEKVLRGIELLTDLLNNMDATTNFVWYQNCKIKKSAIRKGIELYEMAVDSFIGKSLNSDKSDGSSMGAGPWVDMAGLLAPKSEVEKMIGIIVAGESDIADIQKNLNKMYYDYPVYSCNFVDELLQKRLQKSISELTLDEKSDLIKQGEKADNVFNDMILRDARKEFNAVSKTGFGIDGDEADKNADFEAVRGIFDSHPFVIERKND
ncbi:MAG: DUF4954 family protein [Paludibacter sp.]|nr:DUF4954 family protein [Paludibacter sp.]